MIALLQQADFDPTDRHQHFMFDLAVDEDGQRLYGGEANEGVVFQIGQIR